MPYFFQDGLSENFPYKNIPKRLLQGTNIQTISTSLDGSLFSKVKGIRKDEQDRDKGTRTTNKKQTTNKQQTEDHAGIWSKESPSKSSCSYSHDILPHPHLFLQCSDRIRCRLQVHQSCTLERPTGLSEPVSAPFIPGRKS